VITQAELQQDLQRVASELFARFTEASLPLEHRPTEIRDEGLRYLLRVDSSALDIVTGPTPETNLLDMVVFVRLSRSVFERHWLSVFGEDGPAFLTAWRDNEADVGAIAKKVLSDEKLAWLDAQIDEWLQRNPDRIKVEGIRFTSFSQIERGISAERAREASGLFGAVRAATRSADEALLLAERLRFAMSRAPFLLRLQARLGVSEITTEEIARLEELTRGLRKSSEVGDLTTRLSTLAREGQTAAKETQEALAALKPVLDRLPPPEEIHRLLASTSTLTEQNIALLERAERVLGQLQGLLPKDPQTTVSTITSAERRLDRVTRRGLAYLVALGAAWCVLFWGGYVLARLVLARRASLQR
jgi:hypothetical protein